MGECGLTELIPNDHDPASAAFGLVSIKPDFIPHIPVFVQNIVYAQCGHLHHAHSGVVCHQQHCPVACGMLARGNKVY
jgi:hypothetical protein